MDLRIFGYDNIDVLVEFVDEKAMVKQKYLVRVSGKLFRIDYPAIDKLIAIVGTWGQVF